MNNDDVVKPVMDNKVQYAGSKHFSITNDFKNEFIGMYVNAHRFKQVLDAYRGKVPQQGDKISVDFENGQSRTYQVIETGKNIDVIYKRKDKYSLKCRKVGKNEENYPDEIVIGYSRGSFESL